MIFNLCADQNVLDNSVHLVRIVEKLFFRDNFIYTFHRLKPVSYAICTKPSDWKEVLNSNSNYYAWIKLKDCALNEEFLFLEEPSLYSEHDIAIFFIHKHEFLECVNAHLILFKKYLGADFDPSDLLKKLISKQITLRKSIKNNEILLGILLGYGELNSTFYHEYCFGHPSQVPRKMQDPEYKTIGPEVFPLRLLNPCRCMGPKGDSGKLHEKLSEEYLWLCHKYSSNDSIKKVADKLFRNPKSY